MATHFDGPRSLGPARSPHSVCPPAVASNALRDPQTTRVLAHLENISLQNCRPSASRRNQNVLPQADDQEIAGDLTQTLQPAARPRPAHSSIANNTVNQC